MDSLTMSPSEAAGSAESGPPGSGSSGPSRRARARDWVGRVALVYLALMMAGLEVGRETQRIITSPVIMPTTGGRYAPDEIARFLDWAAGGAGASKAYSFRALRRWAGEVPVSLHGQVTETVRRRMEGLIEEAGELLGPGRIHLLEQGLGAVEIHVVDPIRFPDLHAEAKATDDWFQWFWWEPGGELKRALVLVSAELEPEERQAHLGRLFLQSLGLLGRGRAPAGSLLGPEEEAPAEGLSPFDRRMLEMLYRPELRPGMSRLVMEAELRKVPAA